MRVQVPKIAIGLLIGVGLVATLSALQTAKRPSAEEVAPIYRAFALQADPRLDPGADFALAEREVPDLWEGLGFQIFSAVLRINGQATQRRDFFSYHQGKILPLPSTLGGPGILSMVAGKDALYYSYSAGSGVHRSVVARIMIDHGQLVHREAEPFISNELPLRDLFIEKQPDGSLAVWTGLYEGVNRWSRVARYGTINQAIRDQVSIAKKK